jgi:photosystem II stability/assembly factor-like uncharacterized protein
MHYRQLLALSAVICAIPAGTSAQTPIPRPKSEGSLATILDALRPRELGPTNMGGRIMDFSVSEANPDLFYVATASGGLFKTQNGGDTFDAVFDYGSSVSMGAVAICQSKPNVVYVGTGEQSSRNSVAWGDGVYKSVDGGKTWAHIGLRETRHISEIYVDPKNPDVVFVAAIGRLWGRSEERGLYKSTDGGKTWRLVLNRGDRAGIIDLDVNPKNPNIMFACAWDRLRKPYVMASGGLESGIFKSVDGGETWKPVTKGLPNTTVGRCAISIHAKDPKIMVATVEFVPPKDTSNPFAGEVNGQGNEEREIDGSQPNIFAEQGGQARTQTPAATKPAPQKPADPDAWRKSVPNGSQMNGGGIFISRDGGESWSLLRMLNPRPFYFSNPNIDPVNPNRIYVGGLNLLVTENLGKDWKLIGSNTHADHHTFWIDPKNPKHLLTGCDGGVYSSKDQGTSWRHHNQLAIGQFYAVDFDNQFPYWVYGGLQDNGTWGLPTQTNNGPVGPWNATNLNGGDGFHVAVDKVESEWVYSESQGGATARLNRKTGARKSIRPTLQGETLRFNWSTPFMLSPHDNKTVYIGSNRLMKSTDRGDTWKAISPDLTTMSPRKIKSGELSKRLSINIESTGAENHCTIITLDESRLVPGRLVTGSDDGQVNVSLDNGASWSDVTSKLSGLPTNTWISRVLWSKWEKDRLYVTADGHRNNDFRSYVYVSEDAGKTFKSLAGSLPDYDSVYVVKEGENNPDLLFLGSEMSLRFSTDRGATWSRIRGNFPTVAVHDLKVHPRMKDLIVGTHGRAIWTIDISALEGMPKNFVADSSDRAPKEPVILGASPAIYSAFDTGSPLDGDTFGGSPNNGSAVRVYVWIPKDLPENAAITATYQGATGDEQSILLNDAATASLKKRGVGVLTWQSRGFSRTMPGEYTIRINVNGTVLKTKTEIIAPKSF